MICNKSMISFSHGYKLSRIEDDAVTLQADIPPFTMLLCMKKWRKQEALLDDSTNLKDSSNQWCAYASLTKLSHNKHLQLGYLWVAAWLVYCLCMSSHLVYLAQLSHHRKPENNNNKHTAFSYIITASIWQTTNIPGLHHADLNLKDRIVTGR